MNFGVIMSISTIKCNRVSSFSEMLNRRKKGIIVLIFIDEENKD